MNIFDKRRNWKIITLKLSIILIILLMLVFVISFDKKIYNKYESFTGHFNLDYDLLIESPIITPINGIITFGNPNATLTIIGFIDYESPFSKKFHEKVYSKIKEEYIDTGLVNYVVIDNPLLNIHKKSLLYAQAVHCADEQGMSEEYHNLLLTKKTVTEIDVDMFAQNLSLNYTQFRECINTKKYEFDILEEIGYAENNNIIRNPTIIIDNVKIEGVKTFKEIDKIIKEKLNID
ncbi:MAG: thioredoxin domain-containing protein [Candidatus Woesearchaeota archaeon]|jgi:protein-disulfide isomerase|nr:thioredoxin domain-containing protein [Candidatus Woesearchaeota archaeon]